jgi:hypothetical protein
MTRNISVEASKVIELLTRPEDNSIEAQDAYYQGIFTNPLALLVKLADIADNLNEHRLALLPAPVQEKARAKYAHELEILAMTEGQKNWFSERILDLPGELTQNCPVCGCCVLSSQRYPRYVCHWCTLSTTDVNGKTISIYNSHILGYGVKVDGLEVESEYPVFVKGAPCT